MYVWSYKRHLILWTLMNFLPLLSFEVTVKNTQLKPCKKNKRLCVTNPGDCDLRPPLSSQETLNVSCSYQITAKGSSVSCDWGQRSDLQTDASLIFSSVNNVSHCGSIFNPAAVLNVTVRMKDLRAGLEIWSRPHTIFLLNAYKPSQPAGLSVLGSTEDSLVVSWHSGHDGLCRLRHRPNSTHMWTQVADSFPAPANHNLTYTIRNLLPFKVYRASVACRTTYGIWSAWSSDANGRTLDRKPSRPSAVCYRVEKTVSSRSLLHLKWKTPEPDETGGRILGYQVGVHPNEKIQNLTETEAVLEVEEGNSSATVRAFNTAGLGAVALLNISTENHITLPSVRNLWISSLFPENQTLLVQWTLPSSPISHVSVEWREQKRPSASRWSRVDSAAASAVIRDVDPDESYLVSVFPVFHQQCGPAQALAASLQLGALMEAVDLKVVGTNKTTVTVMWAWQRRSQPIRVKGYRAMLRRDSDTRTLPLWPDQRQHTFFNLTPNTEYSLLLLADGAPRSAVTVTTHYDEVPALATAAPVLLLAVAVIIIAILSRTAYKSHFFPPISSPRLSTTAQWLMSPEPKKCSERNILKIRDFEVTDVVGNQSLILLGPKSPTSSEDDRKDSSLLSTGGPGETSHISPDVAFETRPITDELSYRHGDGVYAAQDSMRDDNCCSSQKGGGIDRKEAAEKIQLQEFSFLTDFLRKPVSEVTFGLTGGSYLICEVEYLANGCIRPETTT